MTVYVDEIRTYPAEAIKGQARRYGHQWSHMTADTVEELHAMAKTIGHQRMWFQAHASVPHYDVVPSRRQRAIDAGAVFKSAREQALGRLKAKEEGESDGG